MGSEGQLALADFACRSQSLASAGPGSRANSTRNEGVPGSNPGVGFPFQSGAEPFPNKSEALHPPNPEQIPNISRWHQLPWRCWQGAPRLTDELAALGLPISDANAGRQIPAADCARLGQSALVGMDWLALTFV